MEVLCRPAIIANMQALIMTSLFLGWLACQAGANVLFRYGACVPGRWWLGFALGNLVGMSSILFFMGLQRSYPDRPAVVLAICGGGAFVAAQVAVSLVFRQPIAIGQYLGIAVIVAGMCMMFLMQKP